MSTEQVMLDAVVKEKVRRWKEFHGQLPKQVAIPSLKGLGDAWGSSIDPMDAVSLSSSLTGKKPLPAFFVFTGPPGTGKTSLGAAVAKHLFIRGKYRSLQYVTGSDLLWQLSFGNDQGIQPVKRYVNSDILLLDDLDVADPNITATRREGLWSIVNSRWGRGEDAITIITSNTPPSGEGRSIKATVGEAAYDRIMSNASVISFSGKSKRRPVRQ